MIILDHEELQRTVELYRTLRTTRAVAEVLDMSPSAIWHRLRLAGEPVAGPAWQPPCSHRDCARRMHARGMCKLHYQRQLRRERRRTRRKTLRPCRTCGAQTDRPRYCSDACMAVADSIRRGGRWVQHLTTTDRDLAQQTVARLLEEGVRRVGRRQSLRGGQFAAVQRGHVYHVRWRPRAVQDD